MAGKNDEVYDKYSLNVTPKTTLRSGVALLGVRHTYASVANFCKFSAV